MLRPRQIAALLAALVVVATAVVVVVLVNRTAETGLLPFGSYGELVQYIDQAHSDYAGGAMYFGGIRASPENGVAAPNTGSPGVPSTPSYSGTNVQVAGVDEMDTVKTDGTYLYAASGPEVSILLAYPATDLQVVAHIDPSSLLGLGAENLSVEVAGLFLDGGRLAVIASVGGWYGVLRGGPMLVAEPSSPTPPRTYVLLFDVSDPAVPKLAETVGISGAPSAGRMVDGTIYVVTDQWIPMTTGLYALPQVCGGIACTDLSVTRIYHDPASQDAGDYTNILAVDAATGASSAISVITGGSTTLYMSPSALYLAFFKWHTATVSGGGIAVPAFAGSSWTTIYKLLADGLDVHAVASADVPGSVRSQYSMDEWRGELRVATTVSEYTGNGSTVRNDVYVFDRGMRPLGNVTGLAPGESIFAVRFVEDRAYVVTFRNIDPLFVVDLSDPAAPKVLGFVEMPGFSDYLYPLDAGHLLGVGKGAIPAEEGNFAWYQGLKLALYNVTDPAHPSETANVTLGDRGTNSEVLSNPHAFLYIPDRELVVIPVDLAIIDPSQYPQGVPSYAMGNVVWQGVYLFHVNVTTGFQLVGRISQTNETLNVTYGWYSSPTQIHRSLYIGEVLYTVSDTVVQANALDGLGEISRMTYATESYPSPVYLV